MRARPGALGWFVAGGFAGAAILLLAISGSKIAVSAIVSVVDVLQLAATFFLALYIPLRIQSFLDVRRSTKALLIERIRDFVEKVTSVNRAITECANTGETTQLARNQIVYGFKAAQMRLGVLESAIAAEFDSTCVASTNALASTYRSYWKAVTSGDIYSDGVVDRNLWQAQEFKFVCVQAAGNDLIRSIDRN